MFDPRTFRSTYIVNSNIFDFFMCFIQLRLIFDFFDVPRLCATRTVVTDLFLPTSIKKKKNQKCFGWLKKHLKRCILSHFSPYISIYSNESNYLLSLDCHRR